MGVEVAGVITSFLSVQVMWKEVIGGPEDFLIV